MRAHLVPDEDAITAELHKLNIYSAGGHFKAHKDTPRDEDQFGSLVVCLPVPFEGGVLSFEHGGKRDACSWAPKGPQKPSTYGFWGPDGEAKKKEAFDKYQEALLDHKPCNEVQWAAFFGDVTHSISSVTEGHRITLSFVLKRTSAPGARGGESGVISAASFHVDLLTML